MNDKTNGGSARGSRETRAWAAPLAVLALVMASCASVEDGAADRARSAVVGDNCATDAQCDGASEVCCGGTCVSRTSENNCGACGNVCPGTTSCLESATCGCPDPLSRCGDHCVDTGTHESHCGACGNVCADGMACQGGACACGDPALTQCENACVDVVTSNAHCGACGNACGAGQACLGGQCIVACGPAETECGGVCVNTASDAANCGACGNACIPGDPGDPANPGQVCNAGACIEACATPGARRCSDVQTPQACTGGGWVSSPTCGTGNECKAATGTCGVCTGSASAPPWTSLVTTGEAPSPRSSAAMAHDPTDGSMLLFGGLTLWRSGLGNLDMAGDTYRLTGDVWTKLALATSPSARMYHAMATDTARGVVYLFGGQGLGGVFKNDFWQWNGVEWSELCNTAPCNANKPTFRQAPGLAYDAARDRLVLHAGNDGGNLDDTWEWDGATWSRVCGGGTCGVPSPGTLLGNMAYDSVRQRVVYRTGPETREYDGVSWRAVPGNAGPAFTPATQAFVFDPTRRTSVAIGWTGSYASLAVWEWNGACWSSTTASAPSALDGQTTAYDPTNQRLVRFGGNDINTWFGCAALGCQLQFSNGVYVRSSL